MCCRTNTVTAFVHYTVCPYKSLWKWNRYPIELLESHWLKQTLSFDQHAFFLLRQQSSPLFKRDWQTRLLHAQWQRTAKPFEEIITRHLPIWISTHTVSRRVLPVEKIMLFTIGPQTNKIDPIQEMTFSCRMIPLLLVLFQLYLVVSGNELPYFGKRRWGVFMSRQSHPISQHWFVR